MKPSASKDEEQLELLLVGLANGTAIRTAGSLL